MIGPCTIHCPPPEGTNRFTSPALANVAAVKVRSGSIPVAEAASEGCTDRWVVYGKVKGKQLFTAKELTVDPGVSLTITDNGAYGLIVTQGRGRIGNLALECPAMIRYGQMTEDEVFVTYDAARAGVNGNNGITSIVRSGKESFEFQLMKRFF